MPPWGTCQPQVRSFSFIALFAWPAGWPVLFALLTAPFLTALHIRGRIQVSQFLGIKTCGYYRVMKGGAFPYAGIPEGSVYGFGVSRRQRRSVVL